MNQFNPQAGSGFDAELREIRPRHVAPRVAELEESFGSMLRALRYQHPTVVDKKLVPQEDADEVASRAHTFMPARETDASVIKPDTVDEPERSEEMRELEANSRQELDRIHAEASNIRNDG